MKIAPLYHLLKKEPWAEPLIVHTGQHHDLAMSDVFFEDLGLPSPDIHLNTGSGSHAEQTGKVMIAYEKIIIKTKPDIIVVVGDVNSTAACALAASKIQYKSNPFLDKHITQRSSVSSILHSPSNRPLIAHLEAGLRSFDRTMPEEINRVVTDVISDLLWTPSSDADTNLIQEGINPERIIRVGNIMIDSLEMLRDNIINSAFYKKFSLTPKEYGVVTLHRPSNVDNPHILKKLCEILLQISRKTTLVFPLHPRTRKNLEQCSLMDKLNQAADLLILEPERYIHFMNLVFHCRFVITDSGGIQEETTYLGIPCLTLRPNTERPITVLYGTNRLCSEQDIEKQVEIVLNGKCLQHKIPEMWDGKTAQRVTTSIMNICM